MQALLLPESVESIVKSYTPFQITIGHSESSTYLLKGDDRNLYLKMQPLTALESLSIEKDKMLWLQGKLPVPEVVHYEQSGTHEVLIMTEIVGRNASDRCYEANVPQLMKLLAKGLRMIHSVPTASCPFDQSLAVKMKEAHCRVENGQVNEDDFDDIRLGKKAAEVYLELTDKRPVAEELVFAHGDYCLPNIILHAGEVGGFIDWGRGGIADRYQDLALAARSIEYNFGKKHVPLFLREYGEGEPDRSRIEFYQLLDEFY